MRLSLLAILPLMTGCTMTMHSVGDHTTNYHAGANVGWHGARTGASPTARTPASPATGSHTAQAPSRPGTTFTGNTGTPRPAQGSGMASLPSNAARTPQPHPGHPSTTSPRAPQFPTPGHASTTSPRAPQYPNPGHASTTSPRTPGRSTGTARPPQSAGTARPGRGAQTTASTGRATPDRLARPGSGANSGATSGRSTRPGQPGWASTLPTSQPGRPHANPSIPGRKAPPRPGPCAFKRCLPGGMERANPR